MIGQEKRMLVNYLLNEKVPITQISQQLGICRQTIYNHRNKDTSTRTKKLSKLEPFKSYISMRLEEFNLPATTLLDELKKKGYTGGITLVRNFASIIKQKEIQKIVERFETQPGQQAQIDWGECGVIDTSAGKKKLYVFVYVLGYSRMLFAKFTTSTKQPVLFSCLQEAFAALGIPKEIIVDNMKTAVDKNVPSKSVLKFNKTFLDFAEHYGFIPKASPPYWPQVKGKVERGVGYIKKSFLEGREFSDLNSLNSQLTCWINEVANVRIHGTTKEKPINRYAEEKAILTSRLVYEEKDFRGEEIRKVGKDCFISFKGVHYSVHPKACRKTVIVKFVQDIVGSEFSVYLKEELVGQHIIKKPGSTSIMLKEHHDAILALTRQKRKHRYRGKTPKFNQVESQSGFNHLKVTSTHSLQDYQHVIGV